MATPTPPLASPDLGSVAGEAAPDQDAISGALAALRGAISGLVVPAAHPRPAAPSRPALPTGGVVLATDDGRGIARALAADLKALGYSVLRVRHGVGSADVEGVNLTSSAAVAALLERARGRGPLVAIVHASPLRDPGASDGSATRFGPDEARTLALLAQAGAEGLMSSSARGGACLVVAIPGDGSRAEAERLARWVAISERTLAGVRVLGLELDPCGEVEVLAADLVRAVLAGGEVRDRDARTTNVEETPPREADRPRSEAILIGAPDRASWIHVAAALADWLDDAPGARLVDLAATLHLGQPDYPFRVGLVATSAPALASLLRGVIARLADRACRSINDRSGVYWTDPSPEPPPSSRRRPIRRWSVPRRPRIGAIDPEGPAGRGDSGDRVRPVPPPSWSDWLNHEAASRFSRGEPVRAEALLAGRSARKLDLSRPPGRDDASGTCLDSGRGGADPLLEAIRLMDEILDLQVKCASICLGMY